MSDKKIDNKLDDVSIGGDFTGGDSVKKHLPERKDKSLKHGVIIALITGFFVVIAAIVSAVILS